MDFPGKNPGVGCHFLLQEIFPTQGLNLGLLHHRQTLYHLSHQGSLIKMVGGVKSHLESNITPTRDAQRAQTKPCRHQDPEAPETEPDLPLSVWVSPALAQVSSVLPWGQGLWLQQTWEARCVVCVLLEDVTISPTIEPPSTQPTDWSTIIPRSSRNVLKFLGPTTDFPTRGSSKRTENPQGI